MDVEAKTIVFCVSVFLVASSRLKVVRKQRGGRGSLPQLVVFWAEQSGN